MNLWILFLIIIILHEAGHYFAYRYYKYNPKFHLEWYGISIGREVYKTIPINQMMIIAIAGILSGLFLAFLDIKLLIIYLISCSIDISHLVIYTYFYFKNIDLKTVTIADIEAKDWKY